MENFLERPKVAVAEKEGAKQGAAAKGPQGGLEEEEEGRNGCRPGAGIIPQQSWKALLEQRLSLQSREGHTQEQGDVPGMSIHIFIKCLLENIILVFRSLKYQLALEKKM